MLRIDMLRIVSTFCLVVMLHERAFCQQGNDAFGQRQVAQMLDDRPMMRDVLPNGHLVRNWIVSRFDDGAMGERVHWDHREPMGGTGAEHVYSAPSVVRVTNDQRVSGRDKWAMLVFEFINLKRCGHQSELRHAAAKRKVTKRDFVTNSLRLEVDALSETQRFFTEHPLPGVKRATDNFYFGLMNTNTAFTSYLRFLDSGRGGDYDPREYFADMYATLTSGNRQVSSAWKQNHAMQRSGGGEISDSGSSNPAAR